MIIYAYKYCQLQLINTVLKYFKMGLQESLEQRLHGHM